MPLSALAGNVDPHHRVAIADLILCQDKVWETVVKLVREWEPEVVGELTFRELLRALESGSSFEGIAGLWYRDGEAYRRNPPRPVTRLESGELRLPRRDAPVLKGYTMLGRQVDVVETSRGCTFDCSFCSIIEMRGRNFHTYSFERVIEDIRDAQARGAKTLFIVDDNISLNVKRFEALCRALIEARLNRLDYMVQAMTSAIANSADTLPPLMRQAGFRYVFLGIENILDEDLGFLKATAKNSKREHGSRAGNATLTAIEAPPARRTGAACGQEGCPDVATAMRCQATLRRCSKTSSAMRSPDTAGGPSCQGGSQVGRHVRQYPRSSPAPSNRGVRSFFGSTLAAVSGGRLASSGFGSAPT